MAKHWTQTVAGKKRLVELKRERAAAVKVEEAPAAPRKITKMQLAKEDVHRLAILGAELRLAQLLEEVERLRVFLGVQS